MKPRVTSIEIVDALLGYTVQNPIFPRFTVEGHAGELIAIIGRNGVGKSTLLRALAGQQPLLSGIVNIMGMPLGELSRRQRAKYISFVPADPVRVANLRVRDFVATARFPYSGWAGGLSPDDWQVVDESLTMVGIDHIAHRDIMTISDGERQRAMIAFALAQDTQIILLDEPTAFLDLPNKFEVVRLLSQLAKSQGKTIIYPTHDLQGAMGEADMVWMMLPGGLVHGAPEDLALNSHFRQLLDNTQVRFDVRSGTFQNYRQYHYKIAIEGEGDGLTWTRRLVERLGFEVVDAVSIGLMVRIIVGKEGSNWEIVKNGETVFTANSLTELAKNLSEFGRDLTAD